MPLSGSPAGEAPGRAAAAPPPSGEPGDATGGLPAEPALGPGLSGGGPPPGGEAGSAGRRAARPVRGTLLLGLLLALGLAVAAPRKPAPLPPPRPAASESPRPAAALPDIDLDALWVGPFRKAWASAPPLRPFLSVVPALRLALDRAIEAPLLHVIRPLQELRGLRFERPVAWAVKRPREVRAFLEAILDRDYPVDRSTFDQLLLVRLGLAPRDFDLRPFLLDLMAEQVQGAYDPEVRTFFVVPQKPNWLSKLMTSGGPDEDDLVALHELDHALQDQHFDLQAMQEALEDPRSTDREMALQALIEGDATLVMLQHAMVSQGGNPDDVASVAWMSQMLAGMPGMGEFSRAPLYFQRALIFPYYVGMDLVNAVRDQGGWEAVNRMYLDPPRSTEQVLHPEKYLWERDEPRDVRISLPESWHGWESAGEDTGGEFLLRVLLEHHGGDEDAAGGWGGDRLRLYRKGEDVLLVWLTAWDTPQDAEEFVAAVLPVLPGAWNVWRQGDRVALLQDVPSTLLSEVSRALLR